jgi:hypothetical protein
MYPIKEYRLTGFKKSDKLAKKYYAIIENRKDGSTHKLYFGGIKLTGEPYEQYRDTTPLKLYSKYDHLDEDRRKKYIERHGPFDFGVISPNLLSYVYLWS